jgi:ABC-type nitrate/sulfonate/bicarbonate transport system substrate-binding protein
VTIEAGDGSVNTIPKIATGAFPVGFGDFNTVVRFLDQNPGAPVTAVMMIYDKPAFAIVGRKSLGVSEPKDLEGKVLGAPPPDGAWAQFPIFAAANGLDVSKITIEPVGFPTREPMLAEGNVAAVTGFSFSSVISTKRLGVPEDDISNILMADYGVDLYGNAILVNTDWAEANPDTLKAFLEAVAKGWVDAVADPDAAIESLAPAQPRHRQGARARAADDVGRAERDDRLGEGQRHGRHRPRPDGERAGADRDGLHLPDPARRLGALHRRLPARGRLQGRVTEGRRGLAPAAVRLRREYLKPEETGFSKILRRRQENKKAHRA